MAAPVEEYVEGPVPAPLRPYVASLTGYRLTGFAAGVHVGMPSRHLTMIIALDEAITLSGNGLGEDTVRFDAVVTGLHTQPVRVARVDASLAAAWDLLVSRRGGVSIAEVAEQVGWSRRQFTARFAQEFGPRPKLAARVMRFERSRRLMGRTPLAEIAFRCGYADQSHLVRDWRQFAGAAPTQWLRDDALARVG